MLKGQKEGRKYSMCIAGKCLPSFFKVGDKNLVDLKNSKEVSNTVVQSKGRRNWKKIRSKRYQGAGR